MEKTKDQILMETLLSKRMIIRKDLCELVSKLKEINSFIAVVVQRRYENEFNK